MDEITNLRRVSPPPDSNPRMTREYIELHERLGLEAPHKDEKRAAAKRKTIYGLATFVFPFLGILLSGSAAVVGELGIDFPTRPFFIAGATLTVSGVALCWILILKKK